jgi:hypothetical protein
MPHLKARQCEFKLKVLGEIEAGKSQAQAARDYQLTEIAIYDGGSNSRNTKNTFAGQGKAYTDEARLHELERMVGLNPGSRIPGDVAAPGALCRA